MTKLSTLKMGECDPEYIDIRFYRKMANCGYLSLRSMDYMHSRVTNNPFTADNQLKEAYAFMHPKISKSVVLNNTENEDSEHQACCLVSNRVINEDHLNDVKSTEFITEVLGKLDKAESDGVTKMFGYYLICVDMHHLAPAGHSGIHDAIEEILKHPVLEFKVLHKVIGTRYSAEKARSIFMEIMGSNYEKK